MFDHLIYKIQIKPHFGFHDTVRKVALDLFPRRFAETFGQALTHGAWRGERQNIRINRIRIARLSQLLRKRTGLDSFLELQQPKLHGRANLV